MQKYSDERYGRAEPLLYEWELDAYLRHLVRLQRKQPTKVRTYPSPSLPQLIPSSLSLSLFCARV